MSAPVPLGGHRWGSLHGGQLFYGGRHYRLVVYPPGTDGRERLLLRAWLACPLTGTISAAVIVLLLTNLVGTPTALAAGAALWVAGYLGLRHQVRRQRSHLCVVHAEYLNGAGTRAEFDRCRQLVDLASTLAAAESAATRDEVSQVEFECLWGVVHAQARALTAPSSRDRSGPPPSL